MLCITIYGAIRDAYAGDNGASYIYIAFGCSACISSHITQLASAHNDAFGSGAGIIVYTKLSLSLSVYPSLCVRRKCSATEFSER